MKTISTILAAILCSASPLLAQNDAVSQSVPQSEQIANEESKTQLRMGKEAIATLRAAYQNGEYSEFLKEMETAYQSAVAENQLAGLSDMRVPGFPEMKDAEKWEDKAQELQQQKNQELLSAVSDEDDSIFAQKVRSAAANLSTSDQQKAMAQLALHHFMTPKSGKNADENKLIDLDLEYEYKIIRMNKPFTENPTDIRSKQYILRMEKLDKMIVISKSFQDSSLKQAVGLASANFDERLAQNWDLSDLNALARGKVKPSNEREEKIAGILSSHQEKFQDQFKQYLDSQAVAEK